MNPQTITTRANASHFGHHPAAQEHTKPTKKNTPPAAKIDATAAVEAGGKTSEPAAKPKAASKDSGRAVQPQARKEIVFRLEAPAAKSVLLVGEFSGWEKAPVKMLKGGGGLWHANVALAPGRHPYRFLVDGQWQDDPKCAERAQNPFGSFNNILEIN